MTYNKKDVQAARDLQAKWLAEATKTDIQDWLVSKKTIKSEISGTATRSSSKDEQAEGLLKAMHAAQSKKELREQNTSKCTILQFMKKDLAPEIVQSLTALEYTPDSDIEAPVLYKLFKKHHLLIGHD